MRYKKIPALIHFSGGKSNFNRKENGNAIFLLQALSFVDTARKKGWNADICIASQEQLNINSTFINGEIIIQVETKRETYDKPLYFVNFKIRVMT